MASVHILKDRVGILDSQFTDCTHIVSGSNKGNLIDLRREVHRGDPKIRFLRCIPEGNGDSLFMNTSKDAHMQQFFFSSCSSSEESKKVEEKSILPPSHSEKEILLRQYIPVYVLLPVDAIKRDNVFVTMDLFSVNFRALKAAQVDGVRVEVWWGIVEAKGSRNYDWSAYRLLFNLIREHGLKLKVSFCFHQHGGNLDDGYLIPLPPWVTKIGETNPDIFFTSKDGFSNRECLSFGIDNEAILDGRTAVEVYSDFMRSFRANLNDFIDSGVIVEIELGLGPSGELRYPSSNMHSRQFPGNGDFQCYDKYLLSQLKEFGNKRKPSTSGRMRQNHLAFASDDTRIFLQWYTETLLKHADRLLHLARDVFAGCMLKLGVKFPGHTTEITSGYYGQKGDGYKALLKMLARHKAVLNITCNVMQTSGRYWEAQRPEALAQQMGMDISLQNAVPTYTRAAFDYILKLSRSKGLVSDVYVHNMSGFTFLRLGHPLMLENNWREFVSFVRRMHAGLDYHPNPEKHHRPRAPLQHSGNTTSNLSSMEIPFAPLPRHPSPFSGSESFFSKDAPGGGLGVQIENPASGSQNSEDDPA